MIRPLKDLKNKYQGKDIYLIASGASLDYYPKDFFQNRLSVGVNRVTQFFKCTYSVLHHQELIPELIHTDTTLVVSKFRCCITADGMMHHDLLQTNYRTHYQYDTLEQGFSNIDYSAYDLDNHLITAGTTMISALHFCHYLGAKTIFTCGLDGKDVNGKMNFEGYHTEKEHQEFQRGHVDRTKTLILQVCNFIQEKGTNVLGINPFVDLNLKTDMFRPL